MAAGSGRRANVFMRTELAAAMRNVSLTRLGSVSLDSRGDWGVAGGIAPLDYAFSLNEILLIQPENIISPTNPGNTVIDGLAASSSCVRKDGFCGAYHSLRRQRNAAKGTICPTQRSDISGIAIGIDMKSAKENGSAKGFISMIVHCPAI